MAGNPLREFNLKLCEMFDLDPQFVRDIKVISTPHGLVYTATLFQKDGNGAKFLIEDAAGKHPAVHKVRGEWGKTNLPDAPRLNPWDTDLDMPQRVMDGL